MLANVNLKISHHITGSTFFYMCRVAGGAMSCTTYYTIAKLLRYSNFVIDLCGNTHANAKCGHQLAKISQSKPCKFTSSQVIKSSFNLESRNFFHQYHTFVLLSIPGKRCQSRTVYLKPILLHAGTLLPRVNRISTAHQCLQSLQAWQLTENHWGKVH